MRYLYILRVLLKRARVHGILTLLSLLSTLLITSLIASIPVFTDSVGLSILHEELAARAQGNARPIFALRYYRVPSSPEPMTVQEALDTGLWLGSMTARSVGLPLARSYTQIGSHALTIRALPDDTRYAERELSQVRINCIPDVEEHISVIEGRPFEQAAGADLLLVWARPELLAEIGVQVGEEFELFSSRALQPDQPTRFRLAGIWQARDPSGPFWYRNPHNLLENELLTSVEAFARFVSPIMAERIDYTFWYSVLDEGKIRFDRVDEYARGVEVAQIRAQRAYPNMRIDRSPIGPLREVQKRTRVLQRLLFGFSLPMIVLCVVFGAAVSSISARYARREMAIVVSRGTSNLQVFVLNAIEGLAITIPGVALGLLATPALVRLMSYNASFLGFDHSDPIHIATQALDGRLALVSGAVSLSVRLLPALRAHRTSIVSYGRERARPSRVSWAGRVTLTTLLVATTVYSLQVVRSRGTFGMLSWAVDEAGGSGDPLLFLSPTLFVLSLGAVMGQVFPVLMVLPNLLARLWSGTTVFLAVRTLAEESGAYSLPLLLLIVSGCLGGFYASIAKSADAWLVDRWRYQVGSDYSFRQSVEPSSGFGAMVGEDSWLLPISEFLDLPGVTDATRVGAYPAAPPVGTGQKIRLLGIDRHDLSRVTYWRDDYAGETLGSLLNRLAGEPDRLLVSNAFLEDTSLEMGDRLILSVIFEQGVQDVPFAIAGSFESFPTMYEDEATVAVANLDYVFDQIGGIQPHTIWLCTEPDTDGRELWLAIEEMGVVPVGELDSREMIREDQQRLERVGIFGNLSVGFLCGILVAWIAVLAYAAASLLDRAHRLTILRALGLTKSQSLATATAEFVVVVAYGVLGGVLGSILTSRVYVPYFQLTPDTASQVPTFRPLIAWQTIGWMNLAYLGLLLVAGIGMTSRILQRDAFQTLRLGDDE